MGFRNTIAKLEFMPEQHELDEDEELAVHGIHKCYYKNYKIFYYIDTEKTTVYVLSIDFWSATLIKGLSGNDTF